MFHEETTLEEILKSSPKNVEILVKHGVPCPTCPFAKNEMGKLKIGQICQLYGINLKSLLRELNKKK